MSLLDYIICVTLFLATVFGLGAATTASWKLDPLEQFTVTIGVGLSWLFLGAFLIYATSLSWAWFRLTPVLAAAALFWRRREIVRLFGNREMRWTLTAWLMVAAWTQGLLALVQNYSGAAWNNDWLEHHHRARFFLQHWPLDYVFVGFYQLPARPPMANVVTAGFEALTGGSFPCDQVVLSLWSSFVFLPAALFCRLAGGGARRLPVLALLLMLNPAFTQNSTFAWTKLPTAFFVLAGGYFFFTALDPTPSFERFAIAVGLLAAGILVHYSAAPYAVVFAAVWLWRRAVADRGAKFAREAVTGLAVAGPMLGIWFGWALAHYGWRGTLFANSSVIDAGPVTLVSQMQKIGYNIWTTLIPHPLRHVDYSMITQTDALAWFRDYFFLINQVNLPALVGTGGLVALVAAIARDWKVWRQQSGMIRPEWVLGSVAACVFLGIAVHGAKDDWGLAHICLQALGVFGLAMVTARIDRIGCIGRAVLTVGLLWDAAINIGIHYFLQSQPARPEWLSAHDSSEVLLRYGPAAFNAWLKHLVRVPFLSDGVTQPALLVVLLLSLLVFALAWVRKTLKADRQCMLAALLPPDVL